MAKKKPIKKIFENTLIESAEAHPDVTDSVQAEQGDEALKTSNADEKSTDETRVETAESVSADLQNEARPSEPNPQEEGMEMSDAQKQSSNESPAAVNADEPSAEALLEDVRQSLVEAEAEKQQKESRWWRRIGRKKRVEAEPSAANVAIDIPIMPTSLDTVEGQEEKQEPEAESDQIDDLIEMLKTEEAAAESTAAPEIEVASEPEPEIDLEQLKEHAFRPRTPEDEPESDVRSVALEGGEEVFIEVESKVADPLEERLSAFENALKPYRWYVNIALALFGVVVVVIVSLMMFNIYQQTRPQPTQQVSNLPYPASVSLPGGWSFQLGRGTLQAGKWEPQGAEWLEGTEICRWVALPWSRQLEAVVRTLNPKDPIELVMSNNDKLIYEVYSVRQLSLAEMQELDSNSPCLLLILIQPDSEERWVLTALP
jgi:hypothetical protein